MNPNLWELLKFPSFVCETDRVEMLTRIAQGLAKYEVEKLKKTTEVPQETQKVHQQVHQQFENDIRPEVDCRFHSCGCEHCESLGLVRRDQWGYI